MQPGNRSLRFNMPRILTFTLTRLRIACRRSASGGSPCRLVALSSLLAAALAPALADAVELADVSQLLAEPIIGPELALQEAQDYTESRVPRIGEVQSVADWQRRA